MQLLQLAFASDLRCRFQSKSVILSGGRNFGGRIAMAIQTECHAERLGVINLIHLVDAAVAFHATDAAIHVDGVIEIDEIREA